MKKEKSTQLNQKLKLYSTAVAGAAAGFTANAQIVYTDIDPDVVVDELGEFYDIDINKDGIVDFKLQYVKDVLTTNETASLFFQGVSLKGFGKYNRIIGNTTSFGKSSGFIPYAYALNESVYLNSPFGKGLFNGNIQGFIGYGIFGEEIILPGPPFQFGGDDDQYLAFVTFDMGSPHMGWMRLHTDVDNENFEVAVTLKDLAYNKIPMGPVYTGAGADIEDLPLPSNQLAEDIGDNFNATDIQVSFDASSDETNIQMYGVVIAKAEEVEGITLDDFILNEGGHAVDILPDGSPDYTVNFPLGQLDFNGDPVTTGRAYRALIYAYTEVPLYNLGWVTTNEFTLNASPAVASNVVAEDVSDNLDASDMQVSFAHAEDESEIDEYRVMVVPEADIDIFDATAAGAVIAANYTAVPTTGSDIEITLDAGALTYTGATINQSTDYYVFVVSSINGGASFGVSAASNLIRLGTSAPFITEIEIEDLHDQGLSSDLQIRYRVPADITNLNRAEFIFVRKSMSAGLTEKQILDLNYGTTKSYSSMTAGVIDTINLSPIVFDASLNMLAEGIEYLLYVRSDPRNGANRESLSGPVEFIIQSPLDGAENVVVANIARNFNPADWLVLAEKSEDETKVGEYRIMAVKAEEAGSFNVGTANGVAESNYVSVAPTGDNIMAYLPEDLTDVDGNAITQDGEYRFFVLAVANLKSPENKLSEASNSVSLQIVNSLTANALQNGKVYYGHGELNFVIPEISSEAQVLVVSTDGRILFQDMLQPGQTSINPGQLSNGIYIVQLRSEFGNLTKKILIQN